ncbi:hypothetical protein FXN65_13460 [Metapseudomonas lalkuanensis]|uniref:Uncharacterized protein n=1 Tax=Metapseudomonas lalkuanensis TaxID=2604832 RepID=A0A5J6QQR8_9GAMM|nr:hypothetical protein [Pseudomonas lalkuanensis]QEY63026.1 hypothetical protein FXN65_13460 [Pseudomonas lalkuanensis]
MPDIMKEFVDRQEGYAGQVRKFFLGKRVLCCDESGAYQKPFIALRMFKEVFEEGKRYRILDISTLPVFTPADLEYSAEVPFCDEDYDSTVSGLRSIDLAAGDDESLTVIRNGLTVADVRTASEFEIDSEGTALFWALELDYALNRVSIDMSPNAGIHYLMNLGTVAIYKDLHGEWDRMLRMAKQIWRSGLQPNLQDPQALVAKLGGSQHGQLGFGF